MTSPLLRLSAVLDSAPFREKMVRTALKLNTPDASQPHKRTYSEPEVRQMCEGFTALILEDLGQQGTSMRTLFLETLVPGFVAQGLPLSWIVEWNVSFMVLISCEAIADLGAVDRDAAEHWLARFAGVYVGDMAEVIVKIRAEGPG